MGAAFSALIAKIVGIATWFGQLFVAVFVSLWDMVKDAFSWLFDQVLSVAVAAVGAIDVSALSGAATGGWSSLSSELLNILILLGVGTAIKIVASAIAVRMALQLIPFVRLGS